jgi:hypothetical protein
MTKVKEFCPSRASLRGPQDLSTGSNDHFYMVHRRDTEPAEVFYKEIFTLRPLRLCGEL